MDTSTRESEGEGETSPFFASQVSTRKAMEELLGILTFSSSTSSESSDSSSPPVASTPTTFKFPPISSATNSSSPASTTSPSSASSTSNESNPGTVSSSSLSSSASSSAPSSSLLSPIDFPINLVFPPPGSTTAAETMSAPIEFNLADAFKQPPSSTPPSPDSDSASASSSTPPLDLSYLNTFPKITLPSPSPASSAASSTPDMKDAIRPSTQTVTSAEKARKARELSLDKREFQKRMLDKAKEDGTAEEHAVIQLKIQQAMQKSFATAVNPISSPTSPIDSKGDGNNSNNSSNITNTTNNSGDAPLLDLRPAMANLLLLNPEFNIDRQQFRLSSNEESAGLFPELSRSYGVVEDAFDEVHLKPEAKAVVWDEDLEFLYDEARRLVFGWGLAKDIYVGIRKLRLARRNGHLGAGWDLQCVEWQEESNEDVVFNWNKAADLYARIVQEEKDKNKARKQRPVSTPSNDAADSSVEKPPVVQDAEALLSRKRMSIALANLAKCYHDGLGVTDNIAKAEKLWAKAIRKGDYCIALYNLALCFDKENSDASREVLDVNPLLLYPHPRDPHKALHLYRRATEKGYPRAMHNQAILFRNSEYLKDQVPKVTLPALPGHRCKPCMEMTEEEHEEMLRKVVAWLPNLPTAENEVPVAKLLRRAGDCGLADAVFKLAILWNRLDQWQQSRQRYGTWGQEGPQIQPPEVSHETIMALSNDLMARARDAGHPGALNYIAAEQWRKTSLRQSAEDDSNPYPAYMEMFRQAAMNEIGRHTRELNDDYVNILMTTNEHPDRKTFSFPTLADLACIVLRTRLMKRRARREDLQKWQLESDLTTPIEEVIDDTDDGGKEKVPWVVPEELEEKLTKGFGYCSRPGCTKIYFGEGRVQRVFCMKRTRMWEEADNAANPQQPYFYMVGTNAPDRNPIPEDERKRLESLHDIPLRFCSVLCGEVNLERRATGEVVIPLDCFKFKISEDSNFAIESAEKENEKEIDDKEKGKDTEQEQKQKEEKEETPAECKTQ